MKKMQVKKIGNSKIMLYLSAIIVGLLISTNFKFNGISKFMDLDTKEYKSILEERNKLTREINALEKDNKELNSKILSYSTTDNKSEKIIKDMKDQIEYYGMLSGNNEVKGTGIKITINDGIINENDTDFEKTNKILHDKDMRNLLNSVKLAGAQAITVNNHRITLHSAVQCNGSFLLFDDGSVEKAPFSIFAIGDPESLKTNLNKEGGYLKKLKARGLNINLESIGEIAMPAADIREISFALEYIK